MKGKARTPEQVRGGDFAGAGVETRHLCAVDVPSFASQLVVPAFHRIGSSL